MRVFTAEREKLSTWERDVANRAVEVKTAEGLYQRVVWAPETDKIKSVWVGERFLVSVETNFGGELVHVHTVLPMHPDAKGKARVIEVGIYPSGHYGASVIRGGGGTEGRVEGMLSGQPGEVVVFRQEYNPRLPIQDYRMVVSNKLVDGLAQVMLGMDEGGVMLIRVNDERGRFFYWVFQPEASLMDAVDMEMMLSCEEADLGLIAAERLSEYGAIRYGQLPWGVEYKT